jgi:hypothetical protein
MIKVGVLCTIQKKMSKCNLVAYREAVNSESENAKTADKNNVDCIFMHKFVPVKQNANSKFYKEVIKRLIT